MSRNPFDYFGCPDFALLVQRSCVTGEEDIRWAYASGCTWARAARTLSRELTKPSVRELPFDPAVQSFKLTVSRWDGQGTRPKVILRLQASECTLAQARSYFAAKLRELAGSGPALAPTRRRAHADAHV